MLKGNIEKDHNKKCLVKTKLLMLRFLAIDNEGDLTTDYQSKLLGVFTENCSGANMYFAIGLHPVSQARPSLPSLID